MSFGVVLAASAALFGVVDQQEGRPPLPWRALTTQESEAFDLGYAVFNTQWTPANEPAGRRDGLGPLFNAPSCDACHNSRRRGRGPADAGPAPIELVIQVGTQDADGAVRHGSQRFGFILNTSANGGLKPEAEVTIRYRETMRELPDGSRISLRMPTYDVLPGDSAPLDSSLVLMPRMPQSVQGVGLLERVSAKEIQKLAEPTGGVHESVRGRVAWVDDKGQRKIGRFGWQATEPTVASQIAAAFSREMGLTSPLISHIDCDCDKLPNGGTPEVEPALFNAVVTFQDLHAVARTIELQLPEDQASKAKASFIALGCAECHRAELKLDWGEAIHPYTDLLLHDLGPDLADHDVSGHAVHSEWRTAPLWGINASVATGRPVRLMHDGRARSVAEAIAWHGGAAADTRKAFESLSAKERAELVRWIESL